MAVRDPRIIGARIAKRRHQLDLTQEELALALGVSKSTVANWERGTAYPKRKLGKVEQFLGITLDNDDDTNGEPPAPAPAPLRGKTPTIQEVRDMMNLFIQGGEEYEPPESPTAEEGRNERRRRMA